MNISSTSFPSLFESSFGNTENSARDLLNGIKIKNKNNWYLVGNLAREGGINPHRFINAAPDEEDYEILFKGALLNVADSLKPPACVTVGFPYSTYNVYKDLAEKFLSQKSFHLEYDPTTYQKGPVKKVSIELDKFEVIPEIVGGIIGLKKSLPVPPANFIAISLGFGTLEGGMATTSGLLQRTCFSTHGIRLAINNLQRELNKKYFLEMKNEHQLDDAFVKGFIYINRKNIDLKGLRKEILHLYYKEVVSPVMKKYFTDLDFENCEKIYILGGGAYYQDLVDAFNEEFKGIMPVEVAPDAEKLASIGYLYNSLRLSEEQYDKCAGIDLGNSSTIVSTFE
jgi:plasmid segregation protein ParM